MCFKLKLPGCSMWGHAEVPGGECHSVCLGWPFFPWLKGQAEHFLWCSAQSDDLHSNAQTHVLTFPPKIDYDVIKTSCSKIAMTLGIWNDDIYISLEG